MTVPYEFLRSITGPQLQVSGTNVARYPTLNIGDGIELIDEPTVPRWTLSVNSASLAPIISASIGDVVNDAVSASIGAISSSIATDITKLYASTSYLAGQSSAALSASVATDVVKLYASASYINTKFTAVSSSMLVFSASAASEDTKLFASASFINTRVNLLSGSFLTVSNSFVPVSNSFNVLSAAYVVGSGALARKVDFTGSIGATSLTFKNAVVPRYGIVGTINSGSIASLTCSLSTSCYFEFSFRGHIRDTSNNLSYTKVISGMGQTSGSTVLNYVNVNEDNTPTKGALTASIDGSGNLVATLTSASGSTYGYTLFGTYSSWNW